MKGGAIPMDIMKKRWLILIASCFVTLCIGSLYAWSVFAEPMAVYLMEIFTHDLLQNNSEENIIV